MVRSLRGAVLLLLATLPALGAHDARAMPASALCVGRLRVTPSAVHVGARFNIRGTGFTCRTPNKQLYHAAVIMYQPRLGFAIFTAAVPASGRYTISARMPRLLTAAGVLQGHRYAQTATKPGVYYFTVRLSDVYLPPPADALAHVRVTR